MDKPYDITERARRFADDVYVFSQKLLAKSERHVKLVDQLNDAAGSIGANREEAEEGQSKKDFIHKNALALKEARESRYWLRVARARERPLRVEANVLIKEASEIIAILVTIIKNVKSNPHRGDAPE